MNKKKLVISLVSIVIVLVAGVVGVSYALWDTTSHSENFQVNIGHGLDLAIANPSPETADSMKNFAPVGTGDITVGVTSIKIAKFDVVTTTTDTAVESEKLEKVTVNISYSIKFKNSEEDINKYFDVYLMSGAEYESYRNGNDLTTATQLVNNGNAIIDHSVAGVTQGIVIAWKAEYITNDFAANAEFITKFAAKELQVTIDLTAQVVNP